MDHSIAEAAAADNGVELVDFIRAVDQTVGLANHTAQETKSPKAANLGVLYGIARYTAYVGRATSGEEREAYIRDMTDRFAAMIRAHFADPSMK